jgi:hypothetical protein
MDNLKVTEKATAPGSKSVLTASANAMKIEVYDLMYRKSLLIQQVEAIDKQIQSLTKEIHSPGQ